MLEYFMDSHPDLVRDVTSLVLEDLSEVTRKYSKEHIAKELYKRWERLSIARTNLKEASAAIEKSTGDQKFSSKLDKAISLISSKKIDDVESLFPNKIDSVSVLFETLGSLNAERVLMSLCIALQDVISLIRDRNFRSAIALEPFLTLVEQLEDSAAIIADTAVAIQDYLAAYADNKKQSASNKIIGSIRRATYVTACTLMSICATRNRRTSAVISDVLISPAAIRSTVSIARLISVNTPQYLKAHIANIVTMKFGAIKLTRGRAEEVVNTPLVLLKLVAEYAGEDSVQVSSNEANTTAYHNVGELLLEGGFCFSYAVYLYEDSVTQHDSASNGVESSGQLASTNDTVGSMQAIVDCFRECFESNNSCVLPLNSISIKGLKYIIDGSAVLLSDRSIKLGTEIRKFIRSAVICAFRSLDIILESKKSYGCVWDSSTLSVLPGELPKTLKKTLASNHESIFELICDEEVMSKLDKVINDYSYQSCNRHKSMFARFSSIKVRSKLAEQARSVYLKLQQPSRFYSLGRSAFNVRSSDIKEVPNFEGGGMGVCSQVQGLSIQFLQSNLYLK